MENTNKQVTKNNNLGEGLTETQKVRFAQGMSGQVYIQQGESNIEFNLNDLNEEEIQTLVNGCGNILTSLSASLYGRIKEVSK